MSKLKIHKIDFSNNCELKFKVIVIFVDLCAGIELVQAAAMFILKIKENHKIPQSVINTMVESITSLFQLHLSHIDDVVTQHLKLRIILLS